MTGSITSATSSNPAINAQRNVRDIIQEGEYARGANLSIPGSKSSDLKEHFGQVNFLAKHEKIGEYATDQLRQKQTQLKLVSDIVLTLGDVGGVVNSTLPLNRETSMNAQSYARQALTQISNLLSSFSNVNYGAILNQANINPDGSYNTDYVTSSTPNRFIEILDGKTLPEAIVPEEFRDVIGSLHSIERTAINNPNDNIPAETRAAFNNGMNILLKIQANADINHTELDDVRQEAKVRAGESEDALRRISELDKAAYAKKLQEAAAQTNLLRALEVFQAKFMNRIMDMAV